MVPANEVSEEDGTITNFNRVPIKLNLKAMHKTKSISKFQETFFVKIDGTLNWQKLTIKGSFKGSVEPPKIDGEYLSKEIV